AMAVMLASGLDGINNKLTPPEPVDGNIYAMDKKEREKAGIRELPASLEEALVELEQDPLLLDALGEHCAEHFIESKKIEWDMFRMQVHPWEREQYLSSY